MFQKPDDLPYRSRFGPGMRTTNRHRFFRSPLVKNHPRPRAPGNVNAERGRRGRHIRPSYIHRGRRPGHPLRGAPMLRPHSSKHTMSGAGRRGEFSRIFDFRRFPSRTGTFEARGSGGRARPASAKSPSSPLERRPSPVRSGRSLKTPAARIQSSLPARWN